MLGILNMGHRFCETIGFKTGEAHDFPICLPLLHGSSYIDASFQHGPSVRNVRRFVTMGPWQLDDSSAFPPDQIGGFSTGRTRSDRYNLRQDPTGSAFRSHGNIHAFSTSIASNMVIWNERAFG